MLFSIILHIIMWFFIYWLFYV